jgi:hypothetical protein
MGKKRKFYQNLIYAEKLVSVIPVGKYVYDIRQFTYDADTKTFKGEEGKIWDLNYNHAFPSGKSQFNIFNPNTKNFRRFRLLEEKPDHYKFSSEENEFFCIIDKVIPLMDLVKKVLDSQELS